MSKRNGLVPPGNPAYCPDCDWLLEGRLDAHRGSKFCRQRKRTVGQREALKDQGFTFPLKVGNTRSAGLLLSQLGVPFVSLAEPNDFRISGYLVQQHIGIILQTFAHEDDEEELLKDTRLRKLLTWVQLLGDDERAELDAIYRLGKRTAVKEHVRAHAPKGGRA